MTQKNDLVLVYGSLRVGEFNHKYFAKGLVHLSTFSLPGYDLYSLGSYPGIKKNDDVNRSLEVDLFEIIDSEISNNMDRMELGANYSIEQIETKFGIAKLYVYNGNVRDDNLVESGNWKKR
jgi:gamma-glutamylcyclotransferase (GGCT)/AIG2-like uncharacterized protein YtfP